VGKLRFCLAGEYPLDTNRIGGGVPHVMYLLGETFRERDDIEFSVVTPAKGRSGVDVVSKEGITIYYVGAPKRKVVPNLLAQGARIAPVLADLKPDVINSHHYVTTEAAIRAGCRVVHTLHGVIHKEVRFASRKRKISIYLHGLLEKRVASKADAVMGVAQYALDEYRPWIKAPGYTIPVPIEDVFWNESATAPGKSVVFAGGICRRKNPLTLVRAMAEVVKRHPDAVLHVCGSVVEPAYMAAIQRVVNDHGLDGSVKFLGVVDRDRLAALLGESCALALPSLQESSPGVICQAMAMGRAPIASPVGGVPEMIEDGVTGFVVDANDSDTLADRIAALMDDPGLAQRIGRAAREVARQRYERHRVADRIIEICSSVVNGGRL